MFGAGAGVAASGGQGGEGTAEGGVGIALNVDKRPEAAARSGDIKCEGWLLKRCETVFSTLGCPVLWPWLLSPLLLCRRSVRANNACHDMRHHSVADQSGRGVTLSSMEGIYSDTQVNR